METQVINATEYRNVSLALLNESKTNPRRTFEETALKELAESIRTQGVLSPLLVRPSMLPRIWIGVAARSLFAANSTNPVSGRAPTSRSAGRSTLAYIRSVMHLMFECAARWELFNDRRNPIQIVRVKDGSKRRQRPTVLTVQEYETILGLLKEPYRTMVIVAQCLGLRVSEIAALQWQDFDFERQQLLVQRSIVNGNVDDVKTEYSRDHVPLDAALVEVLLVWSKEATPTEEGWVFASPSTNKPYQTTEIQKRHIRPAGCCLVKCPTCGAGVGVWCSQVKPAPNGKRLLIHEERQAAAGKYGHLGWHTFRHTYRSWLDETGAPMKVQQELMRHASIQTTMNVYGQAMTSSKREANSKVVEMVLKPMKASA